MENQTANRPEPVGRPQMNALACDPDATSLSCQVLALQEEVASLQRRLDEFSGTWPTRMVDPTFVHVPVHARRQATTYSSEGYQRLKESINHSGGNVVPVAVRTLRSDEGIRQVTSGGSLSPAPDAHYSLIYGSLRHQACSELRLPIACTVREMTDTEVFIVAELENTVRVGLTLRESGQRYVAALEENLLYPTKRHLAQAIGARIEDVWRPIALAELPEQVHRSFPAGSKFRPKWISLLAEAHQHDSQGLLARALALQRESQKRSASEILNVLIGRSLPSEQR